MPMARRTWEGSALPEEQAEPDDTAIPAISQADQERFRVDKVKAQVQRVGQSLLGMTVEMDPLDPLQKSFEKALSQELDPS